MIDVVVVVVVVVQNIFFLSRPYVHAKQLFENPTMPTILSLFLLNRYLTAHLLDEFLTFFRFLFLFRYNGVYRSNCNF